MKITIGSLLMVIAGLASADAAILTTPGQVGIPHSKRAEEIESAIYPDPNDFASLEKRGVGTPDPASPVLVPMVLARHNKYRAMHKAPFLQWNATLAQWAQQKAAPCKFAHSGGPYGENLAAGFSDIAASIDAWYNEVSLYNYAAPGFSKSTGHFTQVVWKSTTQVGCAYQTCSGANGVPGKFLMCEYIPAGNVINAGYFAANVIKP